MLQQVKSVVITAPNIQRVEFRIIGTAPYVQNRFSKKAQEMMREKQAAGSTAKKGKARAAKDFAALFGSAMYQASEGWRGIPAPAFRNACISACRLVDFKMTLAKLSLFCEADGYDKDDGTPLVRIISGEPRHVEHATRNATGVADIRVRAMWDHWQAVVRLSFDADQFTSMDVANLLSRVGAQVGIGEGRPDSKSSGGLGWGTFRLSGEDDAPIKASAARTRDVGKAGKRDASTARRRGVGASES